MKSPKLLLLGVSILTFIATSKATISNFMSTLKSEISGGRQLLLNADSSVSVCKQNCNRNYDDAKAYKCSVSNPVFQCKFSSVQFPSFYLTPFATPFKIRSFRNRGGEIIVIILSRPSCRSAQPLVTGGKSENTNVYGVFM